MASMWRRAMLYLGLGPDEDYDDYEVLGGGGPSVPPAREPMRRPGVGVPREQFHNDAVPSGSVRTLGPNSTHDTGSHQHVGATQTNGHAPRSFPERTESGSRGERAAGVGRPRPSPVRSLPVASAKPHVVAPASFTDAQEVADEFKRNVPVIVNLQGVERDLMRRIIDFSSGLCYGLSGQMERVANHVYLLTPSDVEVAPEERRRWRDRHDDT